MSQLRDLLGISAGTKGYSYSCFLTLLAYKENATMMENIENRKLNRSGYPFTVYMNGTITS